MTMPNAIRSSRKGNRATSKRAQLRDILLAALARGDFKVGDQVPTEQELIQKYGVSRPTVRESLASLVADGMLERRRGAGTFVLNLKKTAPKSTTVAVMVPCAAAIEDVFHLLVRGIEDELHEQGYSMILCNHDHRPDKIRRYLPRLMQDQVAGVIFTPIELPKSQEDNLAILREFEDLGLPFVLVDSPVSTETMTRFSVVGTNGFAATREIVRHLTGLGHRRIAYIRGLPDVFTSEQRFAGFKEEMLKQGLEVPDASCPRVQLGPVTFQGQGEIRALLALDPPPTAVVCVHDCIAHNVVEELHRLKVPVPQQMAVVGFDDLSLAAHLDPPLTTVHQPTSRASISTPAVAVSDKAARPAASRPIMILFILVSIFASPLLLLFGIWRVRFMRQTRRAHYFMPLAP